MTNDEYGEDTVALKDDSNRLLRDTQTYEPIRENHDWERIFEDVGLEEDIEKSDEKEEINSSKDFINKDRKSYFQFDEEFHTFLSNFVKTQNKKETQKLCLKGIFFACIMLGFFALIITPLFIVIMSASFSQVSMVVAMISVLIELVSAIIVLPKIIAEYLFNKEEDKNTMEIIKSMQSYNEKKHEHFN